MEIKVFGKPDCSACKDTMKKFETFMGRWQIKAEDVQLQFHDMETVDGMAEGAFNSVEKIPTTIIEKQGNVEARWDGKVPLSQEFQKHFEELRPASPADIN